MARGLKRLIYIVEGLPYLCSEIKGADQLLVFAYAKSRFCHDAAQMGELIKYRDNHKSTLSNVAGISRAFLPLVRSAPCGLPVHGRSHGS